MKEEKVCMDLDTPVIKKWKKIIEKEKRKEQAKIDRQLVEMATGIKFDNGKPPVAEFLLDFAPEIMEVAKVWKFGADKYTKSNWRKVDNGKTRYMNALFRHLLQSETEPTDSESGMSHLIHATFNMLAVLHFELEERKKNGN